MQVALWSASIGALALGGVAIIADRRRNRRADLDKVGFVPWPLVLILALVASAVFARLALGG